MKFYNFVCGFLRGFSKLLFRYEVIGGENIPDEGKYIVISNHKHILDPIFMIAAIRNRRIIPVAKQELFKVPVLGMLMNKFEAIPINRTNPGLSTIKGILNQIKNGRILGIFPEGTRAPMDKFLPAKSGVALFAIKAKADIIPMSVVTNYRLFSKVKVIIGEPIDMSEYYGRKVDKDEYPEIAQRVLDVVEKNYNENLGEVKI